jgi:hypothetical protein
MPRLPIRQRGLDDPAIPMSCRSRRGNVRADGHALGNLPDGQGLAPKLKIAKRQDLVDPKVLEHSG